jgi:hypothetical protein
VVQSGTVASAVQKATLPPAPPCQNCRVQPARGSFAKLILADTESITEGIGDDCVKFLKKIYRKGGSLHSDVVHNAARPISGYTFKSGGNPLDFFHHTYKTEAIAQFHPEIADRAEAHRIALREDAYHKMLEFLRIRSNIANYWALYVAEDPESSRLYGPHQIRFVFAPDSLVLDVTKGVAPDDFWRDVMNELEGRFPGLGVSCSVMHPFFSGLNMPIITMLIAEDSGIDIVDYYQMESKHGQWFQIIRGDKIERTEVK